MIRVLDLTGVAFSLLPHRQVVIERPVILVVVFARRVPRIVRIEVVQPDKEGVITLVAEPVEESIRDNMPADLAVLRYAEQVEEDQVLELVAAEPACPRHQRVVVVVEALLQAAVDRSRGCGGGERRRREAVGAHDVGERKWPRLHRLAVPCIMHVGIEARHDRAVRGRRCGRLADRLVEQHAV